ncbi:MAG: hypothetical protein LBC37_03060 [Zoogloeaceae bacterium]|jgi:hypothetical protein|nr:hypothetical protein [Zoogloeaceae bacterium]
MTESLGMSENRAILTGNRLFYIRIAEMLRPSPRQTFRQSSMHNIDVLL